MPSSRKLAAVAAFFVTGAAVAGCGSSISGNSVATVAGNPISLQAFNHWAYVAAKQQAAQYAAQGLSEPPIVSSNPTDFSSCEKALRAGIPTLRTATALTLKADCKQVFTGTETEVMNFLIQSYWLQLSAHKAGISSADPSAKFAQEFDKVFKKQFPTAKKQQAYLNTELKATGETKADMVFTYGIQQLYAKLLKRAEKPITSKAIAAYYAAHKSAYGTAEMRDLHLVRTKSQADAQAAYNALKGGQSWNAVAKKYAEDASAKANGGTLSNITAGEEESAVSKAIFSAAPNTLTGPVKGIFGYYVLEVTKVTPATQESLAKATPTIKAQLTSTEAQSAQQRVLKGIEKDWKGQTKCRTPNYQTTYCSNYTAPKTTTTATPPASASPTISVGSTSTTKSGTSTKKKK